MAAVIRGQLRGNRCVEQLKKRWCELEFKSEEEPGSGRVQSGGSGTTENVEYGRDSFKMANTESRRDEKRSRQKSAESRIERTVTWEK